MMGMYDTIRCRYPLPVAGTNDIEYQTKDTLAQFMDHYEIREDGTLWYEEYDTEDHSKRGLWLAEHPGQEVPRDDPELSGLDAWCGCLTRVRKHWEPVAFTGEIRFYGSTGPGSGGDWLEWSAYFHDGKLRELHQMEEKRGSCATPDSPIAP